MKSYQSAYRDFVKSIAIQTMDASGLLDKVVEDFANYLQGKTFQITEEVLEEFEFQLENTLADHFFTAEEIESIENNNPDRQTQLKLIAFTIYDVYYPNELYTSHKDLKDLIKDQEELDENEFSDIDIGLMIKFMQEF